MRGIPESDKYRCIKSDGIIYRGLAKYRGIPPGGTDFQEGTICCISSSQLLLLLSSDTAYQAQGFTWWNQLMKQ